MAGKHDIVKVQMAPSEQIFEFVTINEFKAFGNGKLLNLQVALLPRVTKLNKKSEIRDSI